MTEPKLITGPAGRCGGRAGQPFASASGSCLTEANPISYHARGTRNRPGEGGGVASHRRSRFHFFLGDDAAANDDDDRLLSAGGAVLVPVHHQFAGKIPCAYGRQ